LRSTRKRWGLALAIIAVLAFPVVASAATPPTTKKREQKQNKKISTASTQARNAARAIPVLAAQLGTVNASVTAIIGDLGSPKDLVNRVNFVIAAVGSLANDVNGLKAVDTSFGKQIVQLQKQTIVASQLSMAGSPQPDCFVESPPLPTSKNSQTYSATCVITTATDPGGATISLPTSCRSSKTNSGSCAHARVLSLVIAGGGPTPARGSEVNITQRNRLTPQGDAGSFAKGLQSSDANTSDLLADVPSGQKTVINGVGGTTTVQLTFQAYDDNPDDSDRPPGS
jgi:hypothetical protein